MSIMVEDESKKEEEVCKSFVFEQVSIFMKEGPASGEFEFPCQ